MTQPNVTSQPQADATGGQLCRFCSACPVTAPLDMDLRGRLWVTVHHRPCSNPTGPLDEAPHRTNRGVISYLINQVAVARRVTTLADPRPA